METARALTARLADLLAREHATLADFLVALAEFDQHRRWAELGHASLFYFLHRELGLSKGAAYYRKTAAELVQRFPEIVAPLRDGRLCFTSVVELSKVLTPENRAEVLPRFFHRSKREAAAVAAEIRPTEAAPHRTVVTAVRAEAPLAVLDSPAAPPIGPDLRQVLVHPDEPAAIRVSASMAAPTPARADARSSRRSVVEPLTAELSRLHVTVSRRLLEKLAAAKDALSHSHPGASDEEIIEAGLDLVLAAHAKRKGLVEKPRKARPPADPGTISAEVKRAAWLRAGGRCEWRLDSGETCGSTTRLEYDHHPIPKAHGGPATIDNIRLHCRCHNIAGARRVFGDAWMDRFAPGSRRAGESSSSAPPG
jgi:hypothetical protein